jgi:hypothetical protein
MYSIGSTQKYFLHVGFPIICLIGLEGRKNNNFNLFFMAIIKGFAIDGISGHVGKVVFYNSNGKQQMRSMPKQYTDKNSDTQQNQRYARFSPLIHYAKQLKGFAKDFYQSKPAGKTAFAEFCHQLSMAFGGTLASPTVNLKFATIGNGDLPQRGLLTAAKNSTSKIDVTWPATESDFGETDDDQVFFVISKSDTSSAYVSKLTEVRGDVSATITVPPSLVGQQVFISSPYFISPDNKKTSLFQAEDTIGAINLA